jgi:uncharacterized protein (TIGR02391 family)
MLEAVKSVGEKIRAKTGLTDDGGPLIDRALGGTPPMLAINTLLSESEIREQRGFANLVRGAFGMFRNPTAHAARITSYVFMPEIGWRKRMRGIISAS